MTKALMVDARENDSFDFAGLSVRWKVDGNQTGGRFSVVHPPSRRARSGRRCTISTTRINEMRFESVPDLCQRFGLTFPAL